MYGRPGCSNCKALRADLADNHIPYRFKNIDEDRSIDKEMTRRVDADYHRSTSFMLPVVKIGGEVLVTPRYSQIALRYGTNEIRPSE